MHGNHPGGEMVRWTGSGVPPGDGSFSQGIADQRAAARAASQD